MESTPSTAPDWIPRILVVRPPKPLRRPVTREIGTSGKSGCSNRARNITVAGRDEQQLGNANPSALLMRGRLAAHGLSGVPRAGAVEGVESLDGPGFANASTHCPGDSEEFTEFLHRGAEAL